MSKLSLFLFRRWDRLEGLSTELPFKRCLILPPKYSFWPAEEWLNWSRTGKAQRQRSCTAEVFCVGTLYARHLYCGRTCRSRAISLPHPWQYHRERSHKEGPPLPSMCRALGDQLSLASGTLPRGWKRSCESSCSSLQHELAGPREETESKR